MVRNSNFKFILSSSGEEWQFHIVTDIYWQELQFHIAILTSSGEEW